MTTAPDPRHPDAPDRVDVPARPGIDTDAVTMLNEVPLTEDEAGYVEAARAANTMRGYRSDWREFTTWCTSKTLDPLPAAPATITGYLTDLAHAGGDYPAFAGKSLVSVVSSAPRRQGPSSGAWTPEVATAAARGAGEYGVVDRQQGPGRRWAL